MQQNNSKIIAFGERNTNNKYLIPIANNLRNFINFIPKHGIYGFNFLFKPVKNLRFNISFKLFIHRNNKYSSELYLNEHYLITSLIILYFSLFFFSLLLILKKIRKRKQILFIYYIFLFFVLSKLFKYLFKYRELYSIYANGFYSSNLSDSLTIPSRLLLINGVVTLLISKYCIVNHNLLLALIILRCIISIIVLFLFDNLRLNKHRSNRDFSDIQKRITINTYICLLILSDSLLYVYGLRLRFFRDKTESFKQVKSRKFDIFIIFLNLTSIINIYFMINTTLSYYTIWTYGLKQLFLQNFMWNVSDALMSIFLILILWDLDEKSKFSLHFFYKKY